MQTLYSFEYTNYSSLADAPATLVARDQLLIAGGTTVL
jgi:CO/xanthine dehydrogenase FAD-binding subunit